MTNKEKHDKLLSELTYDVFYKLYIEQDMTYNQIAKKFNYVSRDAIKELNTKLYHIEKNLKIVKTLKEKLSYDTFYDLYINKNMVYSEIAEMYNVNKDNVEKLNNRFYKIVKSDTEIHKRILESNLNNHNGSFFNNREKSKETCLKKYGYDNVSKVSSIQEKKNNTCLKNYGYKYPTIVPEIREKMYESQISTLNKKYNRTYTQFETFHDKEKLQSLINDIYNRNGSVYNTNLINYLNYPIDTITAQLRKFQLFDDTPLKYCTFSSIYEDEIVAFIESLGITNYERNARKYLDGKEIDIYLPDYKIGIEFNGNYWHCDLRDKFKDHNGRSVYHQNKSLLAESKGIFLYHIFEYEWIDIKLKNQIKNNLKNMLNKNTEKIYARKCVIMDVSTKDKNDFLNENHIQGSTASKINIGLYYNNKLVSLMCFVKASQGKYNYELNRFCSLAGYNVIGGASKLFKYFIQNYLNDGETVVSYNNISKTKGSLYKILNFKFIKVSSPNYIWWNDMTKDKLSRYQCQFKNEAQIMHDRGYHRICDSGTKTWLFTK